MQAPFPVSGRIEPLKLTPSQAFRFYDVITALSNGTPPLSAAPTPGCLMPLPPLGAPSLSPMCNVDTLLGMATTLWPIIHRLAGLRALKNELSTAVHANAAPSKIAVLRTEFTSTAQAIETALLQWQPQLPPGFIPDDDNDPTNPDKQPSDNRLSSIHNNALAYRHASLVYLYRTLLSRPRVHPSVQTHAHACLTRCTQTVRHQGPMSALLWPLFVAACEAVTPEDRGLAEQAFCEVEKRQGMRNIGRAWRVVGEVWRRGDVYFEMRGDEDLDIEEEGGDGKGEGLEVGEEMWRGVCREMGVSIVFG